MSNRCVLFRCTIFSYKLLRYKDIKILRFCLDARLAMSTFKLSKKGEDTASDIVFMEKCARDGLTPKGLRWRCKGWTQLRRKRF